jgi:hypothetical protein
MAAKLPASILQAMVMVVYRHPEQHNMKFSMAGVMRSSAVQQSWEIYTELARHWLLRSTMYTKPCLSRSLSDTQRLPYSVDKTNKQLWPATR